MKSSVGMDANVLYIQTTISSTVPPLYPAHIPRNTPAAAEISEAMIPTFTAVFAPKTARVSTDLPR